MISAGYRQKPPPWAVSRTLTPPQYRSLWSGLVLGWPMWDWRQRHCEDVSGLGLHGQFGTGLTPTSWVCRDLGSALTFSGTVNESIYVTDPGGNWLDGWSVFSGEITFILSELASANIGLMGKYRPDTGLRSWRWYIPADGTNFGLQVSSDGTAYEQQVTTAAGLTTGVVYQSVFSYNAGVFRTYLNGASIANDGDFGSHLSANATTDNFRVGIRTTAGGGGDSFFHGQILSVRVWNRVISPEEVKRMWESPFGMYSQQWFEMLGKLHSGGAAAGPWQDAGPVAKGIKELVIGGLVNGTSYDVQCKTVDTSENASAGCTPVAQTPVASPATVRNVRDVLQTGPLGASKILRTVRQ